MQRDPGAVRVKPRPEPFANVGKDIASATFAFEHVRVRPGTRSGNAIGDPGEQFSYNPILYSWASRPMMEAAGTPFSRLVEQYVFQPAGMARSARTNRDLPLREDLAAAIAIPYHVDSAGMMVRSPEREAQGDGAAGGVISTVLDLARFDIALDGGKLISPASYTEMMRPMRSRAGESLPYSLGWFAQRHAGHELRWHSGWWEDAYSAL